MTLHSHATTAKMSEPAERFRLPDVPERKPDDMTSAEHLSETGLQHHLKQFLGRSETTIVSGEKYITARRGADMRYPDLLVAFDVDPQAYHEANGYVIAQQGKAPDLVLEIASQGTGHLDIGVKWEFYQGLGITEYWRFDATGEYHGTRLAGERLVDGRYEPMEIEELDDGILQGYSAVLSLNWRWEEGRLGCHDPATGEHIATFDTERARADTAEAALAAERARVRELEALLRRQDPANPGTRA